jgi:7-carboxy-7-deazaguanine synthase
MKGYWINEMFYSLQGEGVRAGTANVFVRFKGCNLACAMEPSEKSPGGFDCDTEFESGMKMSAEDIIDSATARAREKGASNNSLSVIFTGGEPALQLDSSLVSAFKSCGWYTAIETNGSVDVSELGLDFVCVSPKVAEHAVRQLTADEVRYVRGHGQGIPKPTCKATHKLISPAFNGLEMDRSAVDWCIRLVESNPNWRLSVQLHKLWSIR